MINIIKSDQNTKFKLLKKLQSKKYRTLESTFIVEQDKIFQELIAKGNFSANYQLKEVYIRESSYDKFRDKYGSKVSEENIYILTDQLYKEVSDLESSKGYLALVSYEKYGVQELINASSAEQEKRLIIACDAIQDPGNLGTIIRIADAVGACGLILGKGTVDHFSDKVIRSAMGSIFHLPIVNGDLGEILPELETAGYRLVVADMDGISHHDFTWPQATCLIMGNEGQGVGDRILDLPVDRVTINMPGQAESLNVAVASGILAFEFLRS